MSRISWYKVNYKLDLFFTKENSQLAKNIGKFKISFIKPVSNLQNHIKLRIKTFNLN